METNKRQNIKKPWGRIAICVLLLLLVAVSFFFLRHVTRMLPSEQAAARWGADAGRFAQVTGFLPEHAGLSPDAPERISFALHGALVEQGLTPLMPEGGFSYAFAASPITLQISSRDRGPAEVFATGVGGNFFLFQSVQLISGAYLPTDGINHDYVVLDETLAWQLFGAVDVAGLEVFIRDQPFIIAGVYRPNGDFASRAAYGDRPHLFFFYETQAALFGASPITMVTAVLPNPLTGLADEMFIEAMDTLGAEEDAFILVNNTGRYRLAALFSVLRNFGVRSMYQTGLRLPYWENAARMAEDFAALALLLIILLILYPIWCGLRLVVWRFRRRKWRVREMVEKLDSMREARREEKWREAYPMDETEPEEQYDLEEIIRSVRESEGEDYETEM